MANLTVHENPPIDVSGLPQLDDDAFVSLDPAWLRSSLVQIGVVAAVAVGLGVIVSTQVDEAWIPLVVMGAILVVLVLAGVLRTLSVRHTAYQLRAHDISYRRGVISRSVDTLPFVRVQHARVTRGGIERMFGLSTVHINSAGPDLRIPGLRADDADRITALVIERAGDLDESE